MISQFSFISVSPINYLRNISLLHQKKKESMLCPSLLSRGMDINERNLNGDTALMRACYGGNEAVVSLLMRGANIEIKSKVSVCALPSISFYLLLSFLIYF